jgi:hypothetical protein
MESPSPSLVLWEHTELDRSSRHMRIESIKLELDGWTICAANGSLIYWRRPMRDVAAKRGKLELLEAREAEARLLSSNAQVFAADPKPR